MLAPVVISQVIAYSPESKAICGWLQALKSCGCVLGRQVAAASSKGRSWQAQNEFGGGICFACPAAEEEHDNIRIKAQRKHVETLMYCLEQCFTHFIILSCAALKSQMYREMASHIWNVAFDKEMRDFKCDHAAGKDQPLHSFLNRDPPEHIIACTVWRTCTFMTSIFA